MNSDLSDQHWLVLWRHPWVRLEIYEIFTSKTIFVSIRNLESTCPSTHRLKAPSINVVLNKRERIPRYKGWGNLKRKKERKKAERRSSWRKVSPKLVNHLCSHSARSRQIFIVIVIKNSPLWIIKGAPLHWFLVHVSSVHPAVRPADGNLPQIFSHWKTTPN